MKTFRRSLEVLTLLTLVGLTSSCSPGYLIFKLGFLGNRWFPDETANIFKWLGIIIVGGIVLYIAVGSIGALTEEKRVSKREEASMNQIHRHFEDVIYPITGGSGAWIKFLQKVEDDFERGNDPSASIASAREAIKRIREVATEETHLTANMYEADLEERIILGSRLAEVGPYAFNLMGQVPPMHTPHKWAMEILHAKKLIRNRKDPSGHLLNAKIAAKRYLSLNALHALLPAESVTSATYQELKEGYNSKVNKMKEIYLEKIGGNYSSDGFLKYLDNLD